ncbi:MAG: hypothetical protein GX160_09510, partial [Clostridiales bacterium]|nr:hypothetical protein [Clostridiales bacterium]
AKLYPATSEPKPSDPKPEDPKPSDPKPSNPPATSKPPITQTLRQGSRGSQVKILQERLNSLGYNAGTADGIFGSKTKAAVMAFQRANGLVVDGIVGPATIAKLYPPTSQPKPEEPKEDPKEDPKTGVVEYKPNPGELAGKIIIIDAGHGGSDSGAVWEDKNGVVSKKGTKYIEKEFNLDMALRLERILKQAGATVIMTRTTDTYYSLYYRSAFVNKFIVDLEIAAQEKIEQDLSADLDNKIAELDSKQEELGEKDQIEESINQLRNQITAKEEELIELEKESNLQQLKEKLANYISELKELGYDIQEGDNILEKIDSWIAELCDDEETNADRIQVLEDLKENIAEVISKITSIEAKIAELNELEGQKEALEEKLEYLKNLEEQIIPDLNAAIKARRDEKKEVEDLIADLKAKTGKLQTFLNNPSLNSRTGIYTYSSGYKVNEELKEIFNLTRAKYEDNIIFISIHCNASGSSGSTTTASGVQVYYRDNSSSPSDSINKNYYKSYNEEKRIKLAKALLKHTSANTNFKGTWSQPRIGDFHVIREHNLPSVLMEIGFVNNPQDAKLLSQPQTREDAAKGMYLGIVEYFKN